MLFSLIFTYIYGVNQSKPHIVKSFILLFVFVFLKLGIAHAITHEFDHHDMADCEQCVLIVDSNKNQSLDRVSTSYSGELVKNRFETKPITFLYNSPVVHSTYKVTFFNKPPPTFI